MIASATPSTMSVLRRRTSSRGVRGRPSGPSVACRRRRHESVPRGPRRRPIPIPAGLPMPIRTGRAPLRLTHDLPTVPTCRWTCSEPGRSWRRHCPGTRWPVAPRCRPGAPIEVISPCTMITAASATPRTVCANCSTTRIETPSVAISATMLVQLLDDDRRQAHRQLVEEEQRRVGGQRRGPSPASAARRPTACRRAGCGARRAGGSARTARSSISATARAGVASPSGGSRAR